MTTDYQQPPDLETPAPPDPYDTAQPTELGDLIAAEQGVLGGMMLSPAALADVTNTALTGADFYRPAHETIYNAILEVHTQGQPVDAITIADHLTSTKRLRHAGGAVYISTLIRTVVTPANAGWYANIVRERATLRRVEAAGIRVQQLAGAGAGGDVGKIVTAALAEVQHVADLHADGDPSTSSWAPINTVGLDLDVMTAPTMLTRSDGIPLFYAGSIHALVGESESGKTWLALEGCRQELEAGHQVTFIDFEDRVQRVVRRLVELGVDRDVIDQGFRYIRPDGPLGLAEGSHLANAVRGSTLCIIDGVTEAMTMHGLSLSDNEDIAKFLALLPRRIADLGPAVGQIDHVVKDEESRGRYALGGGHKLAGLDGAQYKVIPTTPFGKGKKGHANILVDKDREGWVRAHTIGIKIAELTLDSTPTPDHPDAETGLLRLTLDPPDPGERSSTGEFRPTVLMKRIADHLWVIPGLTQNEIEDAVSGKAQHLRKALRQLVTEGYVHAEPIGNNAHRHTVVIPFEE